MTTMSESETEIRAVIDDWLEALRGRRAADVMRHATGDCVAYTLAPPLVSETANGDGLQAWFDTWDGPMHYELRDLDVTVGGDVAFCHCLTRMAGTKVDGEKPDLWFRKTLGLRKLDGRWKIVHQHESVPFYMDGSFRAAIDLKP